MNKEHGSKTIAFRKRSAQQYRNAPWISLCQQFKTWELLINHVRKACSHGLQPVICVDLDLTTLLAPQKSRDVLGELVFSTIEFDAIANASNGTFSSILKSIWTGSEPALLPGYTSTSIQAYGIYCVAQLQIRTGNIITDDRLDACENWIATRIDAKLRRGYWDRDLTRDGLALGFTQWAAIIDKAGGKIVFLSNRDPSLRDVSLDCIRHLIGCNGATPFIFFGPGGSAFDASSKAAAVAMIEQGVTRGVHYGVAQDGRTIYPSAIPDNSSLTILAVIDDRALNRREIIEASARSGSRLERQGLGTIMDIASAAQEFCPEVDTEGMSTVISSFVIEDKA